MDKKITLKDIRRAYNNITSDDKINVCKHEKEGRYGYCQECGVSRVHPKQMEIIKRMME